MLLHALSLVALLAQGSRAADTLAKAKAQLTSLDYPLALRTAREALEQGDATPAETAAIHALTGELAAAVGERDLAKAEFSRALLLNPAYDAPPNASPRIREPLNEARKAVDTQALAVSATSLGNAEGRVTTRVEINGDLFSLVTGVRLYVSRGGTFRAEPVVPSAELVWTCTSGACPHYVAAVDKSGNQLARAGTPEAPLAVLGLVPQTAPAPAAAIAEAPASWYTRPGPYLALVAAAAAGLAVFFGVSFSNEQSALVSLELDRAGHTMAEALSLDSSRRRDQILLFVSLGAAVAGAAASAFTW
jgi:hypothetical protein